jgi:hypothetical protein
MSREHANIMGCLSDPSWTVQAVGHKLS